MKRCVGNVYMQFGVSLSRVHGDDCDLFYPIEPCHLGEIPHSMSDSCHVAERWAQLSLGIMDWGSNLAGQIVNFTNPS